MRVVGIDPGTMTLDLCGVADGRVFLDRSIPTGGALADPSLLSTVLDTAAPLDLVAGPSGYGLPLTRASDLSEWDLRLAYLAVAGERGGIAGLRAAMRALARLSVPVVLTPGAIHLASVPPHRKVNRVDIGTADKVCAAALALADQVERRRCDPGEASFVLLELGGAFTAALAIDGGRIVDGVGGSSGPLGARAAGALDGEVAWLAGTVTKSMLFAGGAETIAGGAEAFRLAIEDDSAGPGATGRGRLARAAYIESAVKAVVALTVSAPNPREVILSGRLASVDGLRDGLERALRRMLPRSEVRALTGFARLASQGAQGAALLADGLAGGRFAWLVDSLGIRDGSGTALDHLYVIDPSAARARLAQTGAVGGPSVGSG